MAVYKVGQRVKYINNILNPKVPTGSEGFITGIGKGSSGYWVNFPGCVCSDGTSIWGVFSASIVPLTDPRADAFIESIKRLGYEEPRVPTKARDIIDGALILLNEELDKYRGGSQ